MFSLKYFSKITVLFLVFRLTPESATVVYEVWCPSLIIKSKYEIKGEIDQVTAEGKDSCEITYGRFCTHLKLVDF